MGLPKTVITAAKASTRAASDTAPRNSVNLDADLDEDPEDIKVIHFGIVWYGYVSIAGKRYICYNLGYTYTNKNLMLGS